MSASGILSKGIKLGYKTGEGSTYIDLPDLQEIPDLGGDAETVEVTTLADGAHRYIKGLKEYGSLDFKFLYDASAATSSYKVLRGLEDAGTVASYQVTLPDNTTFTFSGEVSTKIDGAGTNAALTFTASIALNSDMTVAFKG